MKSLFTIFFIFSIVLVSHATVFTSNVSGASWSTASTWAKTGTVDADGIPDSDDTVIIANTYNIRLTASIAYCKVLTINAGGTLTGNSKKLFMYGNFTNNGSVLGVLNFYAIADHMVFSSSTPYTNSGDIWIQRTCTIAAGTVINKIGSITIQTNNRGVVNLGSVTLANSGSLLGTVRFSNSGNFWKNDAGSFLKVSSDITKPYSNNLLTCTSSANTVEYAGTCSNIFYTTYNNLNITSSTSKTLTASFTVNGNLLLSGATNIITANANISVGGNFTNNASINFISNSKKISFVGSSATTQIISGTTNTQFYDLEVNNTGGAGIIFNSNQTITHDLIMVKGNCNSNNRLILKSDASSTARIASITTPTNVSFSGNMIMQKYYPGTSAVGYTTFYHDLSSPAQSSTVSDWDNELYISGIGPYDGIGGPAGVDGDVYNGQASMNTYATSTNSFVSVTGSGTILTPGKGYNLLLLDDMDAQTGTGTWYSKTIDTRGVPNFGNVSIPVTRGGAGVGWNLVGNPYASPISFSAGISMTAPATFSTNFIYFYENGNYAAYTRSTTVIPPHQGFWIIRNNNGTNPTTNLTFTEASKVANYTTAYHRLASNYDIKLTLFSSAVGFYHQNDINFDNNASVNFDDDFDAVYKESPHRIAPAIYMIDTKNDVSMINNSIDSKLDEVTIPLGIFTPKAAVYNIDASVLNMDSYNYIWLENVKTGKKYDLNNSVAVEGTEMGTNNDYVLRLSKTKQNSSVSEAILETDLLIFSTENTINLKSSNSDHLIKELLVYDMTGKLMLSQVDVNVVAGNISKIDVSVLASGIYIVKLIDEHGRATSKKLVK